jgi:hypothetical protein
MQNTIALHLAYLVSLLFVLKKVAWCSVIWSRSTVKVMTKSKRNRQVYPPALKQRLDPCCYSSLILYGQDRNQANKNLIERMLPFLVGRDRGGCCISGRYHFTPLTLSLTPPFFCRHTLHTRFFLSGHFCLYRQSLGSKYLGTVIIILSRTPALFPCRSPSWLGGQSDKWKCIRSCQCK